MTKVSTRVAKNQVAEQNFVSTLSKRFKKHSIKMIRIQCRIKVLTSMQSTLVKADIFTTDNRSKLILKPFKIYSIEHILRYSIH